MPFYPNPSPTRLRVTPERPDDITTNTEAKSDTKNQDKQRTPELKQHFEKAPQHEKNIKSANKKTKAKKSKVDQAKLIEPADPFLSRFRKAASLQGYESPDNTGQPPLTETKIN